MTNPLKEFMDLLPEYEALKQRVEGSDQLTACFEHEKPLLDAAIAAIHYLQSGVAVVPVPRPRLSMEMLASLEETWEAMEAVGEDPKDAAALRALLDWHYNFST